MTVEVGALVNVMRFKPNDQRKRQEKTIKRALLQNRINHPK